MIHGNSFEFENLISRYMRSVRADERAKNDILLRDITLNSLAIAGGDIRRYVASIEKLLIANNIKLPTSEDDQ